MLEVEAELAKLREAYPDAAVAGDPNVRLDLYLAAWLKEREQTRRLATVTYNRRVVDLHIAPNIGSTPLRKVTASVVTRLFAALERKKIGARTRREVYVVLHAALGYAARRRAIGRNPMDDIEAPRYRAEARQPLDVKEARKLLKATKRDPYEALYALALYTGMSQGELFGLQRADVDLRARKVAVRRTLENVDGEVKLVDETKRRSRQRSIALPAALVELLRAHLRASAKRRSEISPYVFTDRAGEPLRRQTFVKTEFAELLKRAKVRAISFHDLRHTTASILLAEGTHPKIVQELLGHSRITTTLDTYSHAIPSLGADASARLARVLGGKIGTKQAPKPGDRRNAK